MKPEVGDTVASHSHPLFYMEVKRMNPDSVLCSWKDDDGKEETAKFNIWELKIIMMKGQSDNG